LPGGGAVNKSPSKAAAEKATENLARPAAATKDQFRGPRGAALESRPTKNPAEHSLDTQAEVMTPCRKTGNGMIVIPEKSVP
jgi:hypothetical protein